MPGNCPDIIFGRLAARPKFTTATAHAQKVHVQKAHAQAHHPSTVRRRRGFARIAPTDRPFSAAQEDLSESVFEFDDVSFTVQVKDKETKTLKEKQIVRGVSGVVKSGRVLAILGPSGAVSAQRGAEIHQLI